MTLRAPASGQAAATTRGPATRGPATRGPTTRGPTAQGPTPRAATTGAATTGAGPARPAARQIAVVTGAAGGIGRAVADLLAADGAGVVLSDLDEAACRELAARLNRGRRAGRAVACRLDVTDPDQWTATMRLARRRFGYPTVLVNNAGVIGINDLERVSEPEWSRVVEVCQRGTWLGMKAVVPCMDHAGGGAIVNVASVFALVGSGGAFAYHAAKGAVRAMTTAAAVEFAPRGVRVNAVYPGIVETPMSERIPADVAAELVKATPMGRPASPREVAEAVRFLASPEASYITGAELTVDGGYTAR